jgi:hypothetical protein
MITRAHASSFIGQHVVCRTHEGAIHHGVLHSVTTEGVYLRPIQGRTGLAVAEQKSDAVVLDNAGANELDVEQTWWPFFFLPFFALAFLGPWGWYW